MEVRGVSTIEDVGTLELSPADEERLTGLAKEYSEARAVATAAGHRKDELRKEILAMIGEAGKVAAGPFFISVTAQSRTTLDAAALRVGAAQARFDLTPYQKVSATKVLRVIA